MRPAIHTLEEAPLLPGTGSQISRCYPFDETGSIKMECQCGKPVSFNPMKNTSEIKSASCSYDCYRALVKPFIPMTARLIEVDAHGAEITDPQKKSLCAECGGTQLKHKSTCQHSAAGKLAAKSAAQATRTPCPSCGGEPGRAKGYRHTDECPDSPANKLKRLAEEKRSARGPKVEKPPCPTCGGPAGKMRGWQHTDDCPDSSQNKLKAKQSQPKKMSRGGRKRPAGAE